MKQLLAIAGSGNIMPPKSTWFEPKLKRTGNTLGEMVILSIPVRPLIYAGNRIKYRIAEKKPPVVKLVAVSKAYRPKASLLHIIPVIDVWREQVQNFRRKIFFLLMLNGIS